jgi:DNA mismatch endonuclease (patch repair protein)
VDAATRSRMMAGIKGKNTKPELLLRKALHKRGFRYSLHSKKLPGRPDIVFPSRKAVIFVHGCFWHGHDCRYFRVPSTRPEFWLRKIASNQMRDRYVASRLRESGWRQLIVWECALRRKGASEFDSTVRRVARWLDSNRMSGEVEA